MGLRDQERDHHQPRHGRVRVPDPRRAQGDGADAASLRPQPGRPVRAPAADRRPREADPEGELLPGLRRRCALHLLALGRRLRRADDLRGDPIRAGLGDLRSPGRRRRRGRPDRADPDLRDRLRRHLRLHRRRLGLGLEVRAPGLDAHVRSARQLRGLAGALGARSRPDGPDPFADRDRLCPGRLVVHRPAVRRLRHLHVRRHRRDRTRAVRPPGGRAGARRRLPHRVRRHALRALHDERVHQPDHALGPRRDALPRRLALPGARGSRPALVRAQAVPSHLHLHLDADDVAPPALRPADAVRLEGAAAGGDDQRGRDRDPGGLDL